MSPGRVSVCLCLAAVTCASMLTSCSARRPHAGIGHPRLSVPVYRVQVLHGGAAIVAGEAPDLDGPSVIRVPDWIPVARRPSRAVDGRTIVARYYLYYASHGGSYIRMRWTDDVESARWYPYDNAGAGGLGRGVFDLDLHLASSTPDPKCGLPALVLAPGGTSGTSSAERTPVQSLWLGSVCGGETRKDAHVASPDLHVDDEGRRIVMYFHSVCKCRRQVLANSDPRRPPDVDGIRQATFVATSADGLNFNNAGFNADGEPIGGQEVDLVAHPASYGIGPGVLGPSYMRVFAYRGRLYGLTRNGVVIRAPDDDGDSDNGLEAWTSAPADSRVGSWVAATDKGGSPLDRWVAGRFGSDAEPIHVAVDLVEVMVRGQRRTVLEVFFWVRGGGADSLLRAFYDVGNPAADKDEWFEWDLLRDENGSAVVDEVVTPADVVPSGRLGDPDVFVDPVSGRKYLFFAYGPEGRIGVARLDPLRLQPVDYPPNS